MRRAAIIVAGLALLLVAGCNQKGVRAPCPDNKVCLEAGNGTDPSSLDPHKITGTWEDRIVGDMFVGLTQVDAQGQTIPGMATSWETSPDGLTWTFHLREAKWSDGTAVTADDFVFALRRIMNPATASEYAYLLDFIKNAQPINDGKASPESLGAKALDPRTLQITLEHPTPYLPELAHHQTMYPLPQHVVEKFGIHWSDPGNIVVNGPYKVTSWTLGDKIVAEKNPLYWDAAKVCVDRVTYYAAQDAVAAERQVKTGEFDMDGAIPGNRIPFLRRPGNMPDYVHMHTFLGVSYVFFNGSNPKFKDKRVRQALSMAIDRDFLTHDVLMGGGGITAYTFVPPGVANYTPAALPEWASWPMARRQAEAKRLLAAAGFGPDHPLVFEMKQNGLEPTAFLSSVQADWRQIGVKATLATAESQVAYQYFRMKDFEMGDGGWIADFNDAVSFLGLMQSKNGEMNYGGYNNPQYDALLDAADHEPDAKKRGDELRQAEAIMLDDAPVIPVYFLVNSNLVSPKITGFADNIVDQHRTQYLCFKK